MGDSTRSHRRRLLLPLLLILLLAPLLLINQPIGSEEGTVRQIIDEAGSLISRYGPYIVEYGLPLPNSAPMAITIDEEGHVLLGITNMTSLLHLDPSKLEFRQFRVPLDDGGKSIWDIEIDKSGDIWFTISEDNAVWRLNLRDGRFSRYAMPTRDAFPIKLTIDREGGIWVTELYAGKIAKIHPESGVVEELDVPGDSPAPLGITTGPGGYIWATERNNGRILRIDPKTEEVLIVPTSKPLYTPIGIAVDDEGIVWFVEYAEERGSIFTKLDPRSGSITRYSTSLAEGNSPSLPIWITVDEYGNVWLNQHAGNKIAMFDPREEVLVEYRLPPGATRALSNSLDFVVDDAGNIWFSSWTENKVGMIKRAEKFPFTVEVSPRRLSAEPGEIINLSLKISGDSAEELSLVVSGTLSPTGLVFEETDDLRLLEPPGIRGEYTVDMEVAISRDVKPGNYSLTIGVSDNKLVYSVIVHLNIT